MLANKELGPIWTISPAIIRLYTPTDREELIKLINAIAAEGRWFITKQFVMTRSWENVLFRPADFPDHLLLVADAEGHSIGWCQVFPDLFGQRSEHVGDLGIGVSKSWRNLGIGTALMKNAIEWATNKGLEKLTLDTFSSNSRAIHVFEKTGFIQTGIRHKQYRIQDGYLDQLLMEKTLLTWECLFEIS